MDLNRLIVTKTLKELLEDKFKVESKVIYNGLSDSEFIKEDKN